MELARISHRLIATAEKYAAELGIERVYIPSELEGFYEKCGYRPIDKLTNYGGDVDTVFMKELF